MIKTNPASRLLTLEMITRKTEAAEQIATAISMVDVSVSLPMTWYIDIAHCQVKTTPEWIQHSFYKLRKRHSKTLHLKIAGIENTKHIYIYIGEQFFIVQVWYLHWIWRSPSRTLAFASATPSTFSFELISRSFSMSSFRLLSLAIQAQR